MCCPGGIDTGPTTGTHVRGAHLVPGSTFVRAALGTFLDIFVIEKLVERLAARLIAVEVVNVAVVGAHISDAEHLRHGAAVHLAAGLAIRIKGVVDQVCVLAIARKALELPC